MSVRFIYGRAGSGKTTYCFNDMKQKINDMTPLILLVPDDLSFQAERTLLSTLGECGMIKAQVLSFKRMVYRVFSEAGGLARKHMKPWGKAMLIYYIMEKLKANLQIYSKSVEQQGFVNLIGDIISELKIYDISPEDMEKVCKSEIQDELLKGKLHDIALIYREFESALHKGYIDAEDDLAILRDKLEKSTMFKGAEVWIDGFLVFTPQQYGIIEKIIKMAKRVNITLCTDYLSGGQNIEDMDVFRNSKIIEKRIISICKETGAEIERPVGLNSNILPKFADNPEIGHIEKNLYSYPYKIYEKETKNLSLFIALNRYTEVENIARDIIRLCREEGMRFKDIAVCGRNMETYESLIRAIFSAYNIPCYIDKKRGIGDNPLIVLVLSSIEILSRSWSYESVFRYLKTGLTGIDREDIDEIENYVLACGIKGRAWSEDKDWEYLPKYTYGETDKNDAEEKLGRINSIRKKISEPLLSFYNKIRGKNKVRDISTALYEFLASLAVRERLEKIIEEFKENREFELISEYTQVWNMLCEAMDQIVGVMGDEEVTIDEYLKILSIGFGEEKIGLIPPSMDQVMAGSVERLKGHSIKALYILGVNDGVFPAVSNDEGILNDRDREYLKGIGIELAPDTKFKLFEEQFLVYETLTKTEKYLRISYPIGDHEGKTQRPSIIISRLRKMFKNLTEYSDVICADSDMAYIDHIASPIPTLNEFVGVIGNKKLSPVWREVQRWFLDSPEWKDRFNIAISGLKYTNRAGSIEQRKIRGLYGKPVFSISRLEMYARCPFAYFLQYGLGTRERKVFEITPPDIGNLIHSILLEFSNLLDEKGMSWREMDREWCKGVISDIVEKTVDREGGSILSSSPRYMYIKERLKRIILRAVWLIALHIKRGGFEPRGYEISFGMGGSYPPISLKLENGEEIKLIGRIDRLDTLEKEDGIYVRIVDYKSGNKDFDLSDIYNGLELQLLIYLDAILEHGIKQGNKNIIPGGILYFRIDDPMIRSKLDKSEEEIEKEILKSLKMKGLLLSDVEIIREMDREIDGYSIIIPAMIKKDGTLGSSSSAAAFEDFKNLRRHIKNIIIKHCEEMLKGNISISPYRKNKETSCVYCSFGAVCGFDASIKENSYRVIRNLKDDEVWSLIRSGGEENA